jgi:hypothetical protein
LPLFSPLSISLVAVSQAQRVLTLVLSLSRLLFCSCVAGDVEEVVEVLADSVTNPLLLEEDLQEQKIAVGNVCLSLGPTTALLSLSLSLRV